jgi:probable DNA metabolism protein
MNDDIVYVYDGSFEGLLTAVFDAFKAKADPYDITASPQLFPSVFIETDPAKAQRVWNYIQDFSDDISAFIKYAFLSRLAGKENHILHFIKLLSKHGVSAKNFLTNSSVLALTEAVKNLLNEANSYMGFVRFRKSGGMYYSIIEPKNMVLPFLLLHFSHRMPNENFMIYDKANGFICMYKDGDGDIYEAEDVEILSNIDKEDDAAFERLWRTFYDTLAIKERINHKLRRSHLPKRYWANMTEFW